LPNRILAGQEIHVDELLLGWKWTGLRPAPSKRVRWDDQAPGLDSCRAGLWRSSRELGSHQHEQSSRAMANEASVGDLDSVNAGNTAAVPGTSPEESLVRLVGFLRGEVRRKDEQLLRKEEELRAAQTDFAELEACSREVEQELESDIARLCRLNRALEDTNRALERRLQVELRRVASVMVVQPLQLENEVARLRQRLQRLEQENDDLQTSVRRLEATVEDLEHRLERVEEEAVFAQQECESFKEQSRANAFTSEIKASCVLSADPTGMIRDALELDVYVDETDEESDSSFEEDSVTVETAQRK